MPRMSEKKKREWAVFLNERNRITYNTLCMRCVRGCKQSFRCIVIQCPKFERKEINSDKRRTGKRIKRKDH